MTERSKNVTEDLHRKLFEDQKRRAENERRLSFARKLRILDRMMRDAGKFESSYGGIN